MSRRTRSEHSFGHSGFTLVEVVVVLMIMTVIAGVTVPALLGGRSTDDDLTAATRRVEELFRVARDSAIRAAVPVTVLVDSASASVWLVPEPRPRRVVGVDSTATPPLRVTQPDAFALGEGTPLDLPSSVDLQLGSTRARFTFMPSGAAMGDSLVLRYAGAELIITLDPWTADVLVR